MLTYWTTTPRGYCTDYSVARELRVEFFIFSVVGFDICTSFISSRVFCNDDLEMPFWSELTHGNFGNAARETEVVVMVTGSLEAHGKHLPLGTDTLLPEYLARKIAEKTKALVLPTIPFGESWDFDQCKGTISIKADALFE
jgi:hypothetical protein